MTFKKKALSLFTGTVSLSLIRVLRGLGNLVVYPFIVASYGYELLGVFIVWYSVASGLGRLLTLGSSQAGFRDIGLVKNQDNLSKLYSFRLAISLFFVIVLFGIVVFFNSIPNYLVLLLPVILLGLADGPEWVANNKASVEKLALVKSGCFGLFVVLKIWILLITSEIIWFYFIISLEALSFLLIPYLFFPMRLQRFSWVEIRTILYSRRNLVYDNFFIMIRPRLDTWLVSLLYGSAVAGSYGYARQILYSLLIPAVAFTSVTLRVDEKSSNISDSTEIKSNSLKYMMPYWLYGICMSVFIGSISFIASLTSIEINIPFYWIAIGSSIILPMSIIAGLSRHCLIQEFYDLILKNNMLFCILILVGFMTIWRFSLLESFLELQMFAPLIFTSFISAFIFYMRVYSKHNSRKGNNYGY
jgi:O-antigen/teichoic acid export membrane protein